MFRSHSGSRIVVFKHSMSVGLYPSRFSRATLPRSLPHCYTRAASLHCGLWHPSALISMAPKASDHFWTITNHRDIGEEPYEDAVELKNLLKDSGRLWGFVVYRCTYNDEYRWRRFMEIMDTRVRESLAESSLSPAGRNLVMERLKWDVQDDPVILEDATIDTVRERFKQYRSPTAPGPANVHDEARKGWKGCLSTDYNFCIRINEASLASVLDEAPQPLPRGELGIPYVDLVDVEWELPERLEGDSEEEYLASLDQGYPPMAGYTLGGLPWRRIPLARMMPYVYMDLDESWRINYYFDRPPDVNLNQWVY